MPHRCALRFLGFVSAFVVFATACGPATSSAGSCHPDPQVGGCDPEFAGYSCTGADRPDELVNVNKTVESIVCHGTGEVLSDGATGYCCTKNMTSCAYDPRTVCADPTLFGYSCLGTNRPDSFDSRLTCQQGIRAYGLLTFCCGAAVTGSCTRNANVACESGTLGFTCTGSGIPSETDLGMNQSRSEVPLICSLPSPDPTARMAAGTPADDDYCCFTPSATPPGATCLQDQTVSTCGQGSFAFACTGVDTPDQDYPRIVCGQPGVRGTSQLGLSATLYCCAFSQRP
jgi:hypothetical protein